MAEAGHSRRGLIVAGVILAPPALLAALVLVAAVAVGAALHAVFGGSFSLGPTATAASLGPPVNLGAVHPPAQIVSLDLAVSSGGPCRVSASLLLAQQYVESGYNPSAVSPAGAEGLAQFEPGTFASYEQPVPAGGASPPTPFDPTDSAWAEARMLCSDGVIANPTAALITYNCGNPGPACSSASSGYASEILALAAHIATPAVTPLP